MQTISPFGALTANTIPPADFKKLTRIPIVICYGGYIPDKPSDNGGAMDSWRGRLEMARPFAPCINRHGGDATVVHLPELGIGGNSPLPLCREEQCAACRPAVRMACRKGA